MTKAKRDPPPARVWPFGPDWKPQVDWRPTKQRATRTSEDGDSLDIKPTHRFPQTKGKK